MDTSAAERWDGAPRGSDTAIYAVITACVLINPVLALINNFALTLNAQIVAAVQLLVTLSAVAVIAVRRPRLNWVFIASVCMFLFLVTLKFIVTGSFNARFVYDAAMLPLFLALGASANRFSARFLGFLLIALLVTAMAELVFPDLYAAVLNPRKYFYYTRDWVAAVTAPDASIATSSDIYLGSNRYTGSFFGASHRAGSLFLEPLSLGYFGIIAAIFFVHAPALSLRQRALGIVGCLGLALLSDTRVAVFVIALAIVARHIAGRVTKHGAFAAPYLVLLAVVGLYCAAHALPGDLGGRLGVTGEPLLRADIFNILFGGVDDSKVADSGIVYIIANAGLFGFCLYPAMASGVLLAEERPSAVAVSIMGYLLIALVFGYAPMSIKTASILGYGVATLSRAKASAPLPATGRAYVAG